jgi:FixJ family two-component response regulator
MEPIIYVVDYDEAVRDSLKSLLEAHGMRYRRISTRLGENQLRWITHRLRERPVILDQRARNLRATMFPAGVPA